MQGSGHRQFAPADGTGFSSAAIGDGAHQAALQPWIAMECFQLGEGPVLARMASLDFGSLQVVRERQEASVQKIGATPSNLCTVSYCSYDPAFRFSQHVASSDDTVFFMAGGTEFDLYVPAGAETTYVSLDQDALLAAARALNPACWDAPQPGVTRLQAQHMRLFADAVGMCLLTARKAGATGPGPAADVLRRLVFQTVLQLVAATVPDKSRPTPAARLRALRLCQSARAFAEDRLDSDELPTVADICAAVGASERSLQYAFSSYVGMAPTAYLRRLRLNRVRTVLSEAAPRDTTVTATAMRFGFLHLGRFARDYRQVFGETPSATLAS